MQNLDELKHVFQFALNLKQSRSQGPLCLLVGTKTQSSGIINFQRPGFKDFQFHAASVAWFTCGLEIKLTGYIPQKHSIRTGKTRKVEMYKCSRKYPYPSHGRFFKLDPPPPPLRKFSFSVILSFKKLGF